MTQQIKHLYEFGPYRIDPAKRLLLRGEESVQLPSKVFETLLVLVQHSEEVVSKDDLLKTVWPDSFVEESNLSQSIFLLRKALGESAQDHGFAITIPWRAYASRRKLRRETGFLGTQRADRVSFCPEDDGSHSVFPRFVRIIGLPAAVADKLYFLPRRRAHLQSQFGLHRFDLRGRRAIVHFSSKLRKG
jgi:DNA-binding winged helix-turn-helix (wHTH) protein